MQTGRVMMLHELSRVEHLRRKERLRNHEKGLRMLRLDAGNVRLGELHTSPSSEPAASDAPDDGRSIPASAVQAEARLGPRRRRAANGQVHARALQRPRRPLATSPSIVGHSTPGLADNMRRRASAHPVVGARGGHCPDHPYERALLRSSGASSIACTTRTPTRPVRAESARRVPHICLRDRRDPGRTDRTRPSSRGFSEDH